nr:hypothetical protein [uncultured Psychroserpens sp.]
MMKNYSKLLILLLISIVISACDDESMNNPVEDSSDLVEIQETLNGATTANYIINNDLNTQIMYAGGNYNNQQFTDGLMTSSDFYDANNNLTGRQKFQYDASKRLISKSNYEVEGASFVLNSEINFVYTVNEISSTQINYNIDGTISSTYQPNIFTLNSNNEIIKFEDFNFGGFWEATYTNGNLATINVNGYGNKDGIGTFSYTNQIAANAYQKEKFRFGPQWKINIMLHNQVGGFSFKQLAELGSNFLSGYSHVASDGSNVVSLTVDYEFDSQQRLITQTKNKLFYTSPTNYVITYTYE